MIIDTDNDDSQPVEFARQGFELQELVDLDVDLGSFPVGSELRKV